MSRDVELVSVLVRKMETEERILVTGADGFIGSHLVARAIRRTNR